ncbi:MAG: hypothetical protein QOF26_2713 [Baekduia sp.]|jgi:hypothetical protein|nr:hypothetical protein [Baekduia sp.]
MTFLRNVLHDLIEKRLWPVAVALIVALIAVPIVLGGKSDAGSTPVPVAAAPTGPNGLANHRDAARGQVISLEQQAAGKVVREGTLRNPFVQHHVPKAVDANAGKAVTTAAKSLADALGAGSKSATSTGGGSSTPATPTPATTPPKTTTTPKTTTAPKTDANVADTYRVALKFGESGAEKSYTDVARLTPLPSSDNPFFVYLGLKDDLKTAIFLVSADAVPSGDGTCQPSPEDCEQIELKKGDTEFFDLQSGTAGVVQYQLELTSISKQAAASKASAAVAHARESKAGREYLRQLVADNPDALAGWDYSKSLGLLVEKDPVVVPDVANVPAPVADAADGQAVEQTSTVLTVPATPAP